MIREDKTLMTVDIMELAASERDICLRAIHSC